MDYFEKDLEIPFLKVLSENPNGLPMKRIKKILLNRLNPNGSCAEVSPTRPAEIKLHQRIGNFTPERERRIFTRGYVTYNEDTAIYKIAQSGIKFLNDNEEAYESITKQGFTLKLRDKENDNDYKNVLVEEGSVKYMSSIQRKRSKKLRDLKIKQIKKEHNEKLPCCGCGFDFEDKYDGNGKDFIHIHHTEPIRLKEVVGTITNMEEALKKVVPLCSNCHSIVHRDEDNMLSIQELKKIIAENSK